LLLEIDVWFGVNRASDRPPAASDPRPQADILGVPLGLTFALAGAVIAFGAWLRAQRRAQAFREQNFRSPASHEPAVLMDLRAWSA
jgi:hypothetical protein